jgi:putative aldouronate transport system permease protein
MPQGERFMKNIRNKPFDLVFDSINYLLLTLFFVICIYPFYYILIYSISDPIEVQRGIFLLPAGLTLGNYAEIFKLKGMLNATVVSLARTVGGSCLTLVASSFLAYLMTKNELPGRKLIYRFIIITMYFNAGLIPWYLTMKYYQLNNNFLVYVVPFAVSAYYVILVKTFIEQLPASLEESAKIDGAGYVTIFARIIFPLSKPIIATIFVFAAVGQWNCWMDNYFLVQNAKLKTLQLILYEYLNSAQAIANASNEEKTRLGRVAITPATIKMTITMVVTIPIILVYPFMQKYFVKGIMMGAVKG